MDKILEAEGVTKEWFPETHGPCSRDMRINSYLGAGGLMTLGRIPDPEGAKIVVISFKTPAGAVDAVHMHTYTIVCLDDAVVGRLWLTQQLHQEGNKTPLSKAA